MILVTGGAGQVATELAARAGSRVTRVGRPEFDFDRPDTIAATFDRVRPSLVVNAAAWTAVDAAEKEEAAALRANRDGPAELARLCAGAGIPLIHISTDYVFDGLKGAPYVEDDPTSPTGVYGSSKLAGEQAVLAYDRAVVLRTSWVYAAVGKNFVRTIKTNVLKVAADQQGCPTSAGDLADVETPRAPAQSRCRYDAGRLTRIPPSACPALLNGRDHAKRPRRSRLSSTWTCQTSPSSSRDSPMPLQRSQRPTA